MRILLIQSFFTTPVDTPNIYLEEPLGLISLATFVKKELGESIEIQILDLFELGQGRMTIKNDKFIVGVNNESEICDRIEQFDPDIVGITANFTAYFQDVVDLTHMITNRFDNIDIVLGGAHVSMDSKKILKKHSFINYIIRREGELTFLEFINARMNPNTIDYRTIQGLSYRQGDTIFENEDRPLIPDINILPIPDRSLINLEFYKKINKKILPYTRKVPAASIMTSRGCPFNCIFCSTKNMWERKFRPFSPQRVIEEIQYLYDEYGIREFCIQDDQFVVDNKRVESICNKVIDMKLDVSFSIPAGTSIWKVDRKLLITMKKAGFYRLCFPIESGNEKTIKFIRKPINLKSVKDKIKIANKLGFWTSGNFIIGFPYEKIEDIKATIKYAYMSGIDFPIFFCAKPFRGAELYDIFVKEGLLKEVIHGSHPERSDYDSKYLSAKEINQLYQTAKNGVIKNKIKFYLVPNNFYNHLLPKLKSYNDLKYFIKLFYVMFISKKIENIKKKLISN